MLYWLDFPQIADCWAVIDPYGQSKETEKQLKIGCTFKLPNAVQQSFNLKRKRSKAKARELEPITRFVEKRGDNDECNLTSFIG